MRRAITVCVAATAAVLGVNASSFAALPHDNAVYKGAVTEQNDAAGKITIKSKNKNELKLVKAVNSCGETQKVRNVPVDDNGKFKKSIKMDGIDITIWTVKGKFTSRTKAKGTITEVACSGSPATFVAIEK